MALEDARNFCGAIREFADSLGKTQLPARRRGRRRRRLPGLRPGQPRHPAAEPQRGAGHRQRPSRPARRSPKAWHPAADYLDGFDATSDGFGSHRSLGDRHVSILDDHDHVFGEKLRFSAEIPDDSPVKDHQVCVAVAVQLFTLGIPCIYYGTEQAFAGPAHSQLRYLTAEGWDGRQPRRPLPARSHVRPRTSTRRPRPAPRRRKSRTSTSRCPGFGPFGTAGSHVFDTTSPSYVRIAALCAARAAHPVLRVGRQYPRQLRAPRTPASSSRPPARSSPGPASWIGRKPWSSSTRTGRPPRR